MANNETKKAQTTPETAKDSKKSSKKKTGVFSRLIKYFRDCTSEFKKIIWPTKPAVWKSTGVVLLAIAVIGLFVFALDLGLNSLLGLISNVAGN